MVFYSFAFFILLVQTCDIDAVTSGRLGEWRHEFFVKSELPRHEGNRICNILQFDGVAFPLDSTQFVQEDLVGHVVKDTVCRKENDVTVFDAEICR